MSRSLFLAVVGLAPTAVATASAAGPGPAAAMADPPPHSCNADADVQQLSGAPRSLFLTRCEAGRTAPIAGTPNQPPPQDMAAVCRAKAIGDKITGVSRSNYVRDCVRRSKEP